MTQDKIKAACFQAKCSDNRDENLNNIKNAVIDAHKQGVNLLVLPEVHNNYYFCQVQDSNYYDLAETIPGYTSDFIGQLAKDYNMVIVSSIYEKTLRGLNYNTSVVFETDGTIAGKYRKMHIPHDPEYNEKYYFSPGDLGFKPINTSVGKIGVLICFDQWFPEAARLMALQGAEVIVYPTAIGWCPDDTKEEQQKQVDAWVTIQRSHAIANNVYVISCNRIGLETIEGSNTNGIDFWGNSFIAGPQGEILAKAELNQNQVISSELDYTTISEIRKVWQFFRDRRIDAYQGLLYKQQD